MSKLIHTTAVVHPKAEIADNVEIGAFAVIGEKVKIAEGVKIKPHSHIECAEIGENSVIYTGAIIGTEPQDLGYKGEETKVIIGKNAQIREYVTINRASGEGNVTQVGDNCLLMTSAHMGHNSKLHDNVILANNVILAGHVTVEERAFLGGTIVIHQFCRIGKMVIMSGFSGSRQDIPPYAKTDGRPAKIAGINTIGLKRSGVSSEDREMIKHAYKLLFHSGYNTSQALEHIDQEIPSNNEYVGHLVEFVKSSKRGIIK